MKLNSLAIKCSLIVHRSRKFSAEGFLLTLYKAILSGKASFNEMADRLGGFEPLKMSKQAFWKRINPQAIAFLLDSLATSLQLKTHNDFKLLASWLSRVPANVVITNHSGYRIEKILRACKNDLWDGEILLGEEEKHRCRLIAVRASPEVVRRNLKEARERAASRGKTLSKAQRERLHWHLLVTNLRASELRVREAGELYRCRWKIEILFRAWKQGMNIKARAQPPE